VDLDDVVITGSIAKTKKKAVPVPMTILGEKEIAQVPYRKLSQLLQGKVPGVFSDYGTGAAGSNNSVRLSIRGANSFAKAIERRPNIKIYVDGVELAVNSDELLSSILDNIERIEFVRGPQASTLHGSNAPSGVIQIFTKKGKKKLDVSFRSRIGTVSGKYIPDNTPKEQKHTLSISSFAGASSFALNLNYKKRDNLVPAVNVAPNSTFGINIMGNLDISEKLLVKFNSAYNTHQEGIYDNPIYKEFKHLPYFQKTDNLESKNTDKNFLMGVNIKYVTTSEWVNNLSFGYNSSKYEVNGVLDKNKKREYGRYGSGNFTLKYHTNFDMKFGDFTLPLTAGVENSFYFSDNVSGGIVERGRDVYDGNKISIDGHYTSNTGIFGNAVLGYQDTYFLTLGVRAERNSSFSDELGTSVNPRFGFIVTQTFGSVKIKSRISYGSAIQPPQSSETVRTVKTIPGLFTSIQEENLKLKPKKESGYDLGFDIYIGDNISFEVSYYNQKADDVISKGPDRYNETFDTTYYKNVNLGKIKNEGIEFASKLRLGAFSLNQTFSYTNNKILEIKDETELGYKKGDRLVNVPKFTFNTELIYNIPKLFQSSGPGGSIVLNLFYKGKKRMLDEYRSLYQLYAKNKYLFTKDIIVTGKELWKVRLSFNYWITKHIEASFDLNNLLNDQTPDMSTMHWQRGREMSLGLRVKL